MMLIPKFSFFPFLTSLLVVVSFPEVLRSAVLVHAQQTNNSTTTSSPSAQMSIPPQQAATMATTMESSTIMPRETMAVSSMAPSTIAKEITSIPRETLASSPIALTPSAIPSQSPSKSAMPSLAPNQCSYTPPGIIGFLLINSDPSVQLVFFPLVDIPRNLSALYITNNAWNGTDLLNNEGTLKLLIPPQGIKVANIFGYNTKLMTDVGNWTSVGNTIFSLKSIGDNLFIYCLDSRGNPHFISGVSYTGGWAPSGLSTYRTDQSALPDEINKTGNLVLKGFPNWRQTSTNAGTFDQLLKLFWNASTYQGSTIPFRYTTTSDGWYTHSSLSAISMILCFLVSVIVWL